MAMAVAGHWLAEVVPLPKFVRTDFVSRNYPKIAKSLSFSNAFPPKADQTQAEVGNPDEAIFGGDN